MLMEHTNYRAYLKAELADRIGRNPSYSLRSMARQAGLAPSTLSEVIKGVKNLSIAKAFDVASKLGLKESECDYFCLLVQLDSACDPNHRESLMSKVRAANPRIEVRDLQVDQFKFISDWYHFPILEMTTLDEYEFSPQSIARRLGISPVEAAAAIERMERLELIEKDAQGRYKKTDSRLLTTSKVPNQALRNYHRQMLARATESLETQTPEEKVVGSETFSIGDEQVDEARELIEEFFNKMTKLTTKAKRRTKVYHLGVQFFDLTKPGVQARKVK